MPDQEQNPAENVAEPVVVAQDATAEKPAPEVASEAAAAPDPAAASSEPPPAVVAEQGEVSPPIPHAHRGVQAGPADHPRRVAHLKRHGG